jgi:predicted nucleotidyltransferase
MQSFAAKLHMMITQSNYILSSIQDTLKEVMPANAKVILFGSQARGDAREDSDWDLLVLLDKERLEESDHDRYAYPLFELGWRIDAQIHPILYASSEWAKRKISPFYKNVEQEGVRLC